MPLSSWHTGAIGLGAALRGVKAGHSRTLAEVISCCRKRGHKPTLIAPVSGRIIDLRRRVGMHGNMPPPPSSVTWSDDSSRSANSATLPLADASASGEVCPSTDLRVSRGELPKRVDCRPSPVGRAETERSPPLWQVNVRLPLFSGPKDVASAKWWRLVQPRRCFE